MTYPLAPNGIFWSIQGEGHLRGFQMAFCRLAGCSVGCPGCDTDYSVAERLGPEEVADRVDRVVPKAAKDRWVWITGGEPADRDLGPLLACLREKRLSVAVATSGRKRVIPPVDWLSVSPHGHGDLLQVYGNEVKLVEGLNGLDLDQFVEADCIRGFMYQYVQPRSVPSGEGRWTEDPGSLERCLEFLGRHPDWALSRQDHHTWGVA